MPDFESSLMCQSCGADLIPSDRFCRQCGAPQFSAISHNNKKRILQGNAKWWAVPVIAVLAFAAGIAGQIIFRPTVPTNTSKAGADLTQAKTPTQRKGADIKTARGERTRQARIPSGLLFEPKPLPTKCNDDPLRRLQPVWVAKANNLSNPDFCIDMNGHLVFHESLQKPKFILMTEQYLALEFPTLEDRISLAVGPSTYYPIRIAGNHVIFDIDAANSLIKYVSMANPFSPNFNEEQGRNTFFYFRQVAGGKPPAVEFPAERQSPKRYTREEIKKMLIGKTREQVAKMLGKPDGVTGGGTAGELWTYGSWRGPSRYGPVVYDPITDRVFDRVSIYFRDNLCRDVSFG